MTGGEFGKYLVDMMYSHWATTIVFMFFIGFIRHLQDLLLWESLRKKVKRNRQGLFDSCKLH